MYPTKGMIDTDYNQNPTIPRRATTSWFATSYKRDPSSSSSPCAITNRRLQKGRARIAASKTAVKRKEKSIDYRRGRNQAA